MISETTRISTVRIAEITLTGMFRKTTIAWAPTPAAPKVWATVFRMRIAASARLRFSRRRSQAPAPLAPASFMRSMKVRRTLSSTASKTEQANETPSARRK